MLVTSCPRSLMRELLSSRNQPKQAHDSCPNCTGLPESGHFGYFQKGSRIGLSANIWWAELYQSASAAVVNWKLLLGFNMCVFINMKNTVRITFPLLKTLNYHQRTMWFLHFMASLQLLYTLFYFAAIFLTDGNDQQSLIDRHSSPTLHCVRVSPVGQSPFQCWHQSDRFVISEVAKCQLYFRLCRNTYNAFAHANSEEQRLLFLRNRRYVLILSPLQRGRM